MAQPEFTKKCCDSWWLLGMIPFSINQFQTHRHSMKTLPEFISKSRKIRKNPKTSICSNKKRMACHPKGTPSVTPRGPPFVRLSQHPADAPSQATPARSCHLLSLWPRYGGSSSMFPPMFVAELSLFLLIKTCSVDGKSFLDDKN